LNHLAIVTRSLQAGGAERVIAQLVLYLVKKNTKCTIIILNEKIFYSIPSQADIYTIGQKSKNKYIDKLIRYKKIRNYIKRLKPDVVLAFPEDVGIFVIPALLGTRLPVVVSERNNPWVMPWKKGTRLMRKLFYPFAAGIIFQTEQAASFFPRHIREKGIVLPNPLDLTRIPKPWAGARRKEIVGAGRLDKQKNFPLLIRAFARFHVQHPDYTLTIYGEGPLREELEKLASSLLPKDSYRFPGVTTELLERMRGAAMFVLSSDYEGLPNVLIEAMAMGLPVISTDCPSGGPANLIEDGRNGLLVPVGDENALYKAMSSIAESEELASMLGENALKIKEKLDAAVVAERWRNYLGEVAKKNLREGSKCLR
jgi:glycosyltransferase involved in cell wall biosynthesis